LAARQEASRETMKKSRERDPGAPGSRGCRAGGSAGGVPLSEQEESEVSRLAPGKFEGGLRGFGQCFQSFGDATGKVSVKFSTNSLDARSHRFYKPTRDLPVFARKFSGAL